MTVIDYALIGYVLTRKVADGVYGFSYAEAKEALFPVYATIDELKAQRLALDRAYDNLSTVFERFVDNGFVYWRLK